MWRQVGRTLRIGFDSVPVRLGLLSVLIVAVLFVYSKRSHQAPVAKAVQPTPTSPTEQPEVVSSEFPTVACRDQKISFHFDHSAVKAVKLLTSTAPDLQIASLHLKSKSAQVEFGQSHPNEIALLRVESDTGSHDLAFQSTPSGWKETVAPSEIRISEPFQHQCSDLGADWLSKANRLKIESSRPAQLATQFEEHGSTQIGFTKLTSRHLDPTIVSVRNSSQDLVYWMVVVGA
ncbi:MAG: hypothetical protein JST12_04980 [Armatimonadetes bacterium]|nr:hypothetical protein [Armatimonadota bacterium]